MLADIMNLRKSPDCFTRKNIIETSLKKYKSHSPKAFFKPNDQFPSQFKASRLAKLPTVNRKIDLADCVEANDEQLKGLEEIGIFSEFDHSKKIFDTSHDKLTKRQTIHITDFMRNDQKIRLFKLAGGLKAYISKKHEYKKELFRQESIMNKFFSHKEEFLHIPTHQRYSLKAEKSPESIEEVRSINNSEQIIKINKIIEQCEEAMLIKLPRPFRNS